MAKVKVTTTLRRGKSESLVTFNNTRELLGFLARSGGVVNKDNSITVK